ncbi:hypothetical protein ACM61V_01990 [Sphingomonas sp. TX0543]|uniref:hypothetical protein n=1 Tax=unclassified Sphingomonas TaxID=196159 RepID=UPI0010F8B3BA|nr:hypothetical protein [Sphingomonas sp. 3P27F8]
MGPVFYVMAIMGCGDGQAMCTEARVEPVRYATIQQCQAAAPAALARNTDLSFPEISASCRSNGLQMAQQNARRPRG